MVCLGNICRSPIAEGVLKSKLEDSGLDILVDSAGLLSYHVGEPPDRRAIETAARHGIDISSQRARKFMLYDFENFDLIFAMDQQVYDELISMTADKNERKKTHLFLEFAECKNGSSVPDPYYGTRKDFDHVFQLVDEASVAIADKLMKMFR